MWREDVFYRPSGQRWGRENWGNSHYTSFTAGEIDCVCVFQREKEIVCLCVQLFAYMLPIYSSITHGSSMRGSGWVEVGGGGVHAGWGGRIPVHRPSGSSAYKHSEGHQQIGH